MRELRTEIDIQAPAPHVWDILMDFERYPEWNPFIISIIGKPKLRDRLKVTILRSNGKPMVFNPRVTLHKRNRQFGWLGQVIMTGLFDGHHIFEIEAHTDYSCRFIQREQFSGLLVPLLWQNIRFKTQAGFEAMNIQLKQLAEASFSRSK